MVCTGVTTWLLCTVANEDALRKPLGPVLPTLVSIAFSMLRKCLMPSIGSCCTYCFAGLLGELLQPFALLCEMRFALSLDSATAVVQTLTVDDAACSSLLIPAFNFTGADNATVWARCIDDPVCTHHTQRQPMRCYGCNSVGKIIDANRNSRLMEHLLLKV